MIRYLTLEEVLELHRLVIEQSGGGTGIRDVGMIESAVAQPQMTFGGQELYPDLAEKAAAMCFSLVCNHPFVDGNKRIGIARTLRYHAPFPDPSPDTARDRSGPCAEAVLAGRSLTAH